MPKSETIQRLLDQIEELHVDPRNQDNLKKWVPHPGHAHDNKWRGVPAPADVARGQIPLVVNMELSLKSDLFGYSVKEYFHNPEIYLEKYLEHVVYRFTEIRDDVPVTLEIPVYRSSYFEASLFGRELVHPDDHDAVLSDTPLLKDLADIDALPAVDFNHGEPMSYAKQLYEYVCEETRGREFAVVFMEWLRNPFGVATWLYGEQAFLEATKTEPEGAQRLTAYVAECRNRWMRQRAAYVGQDLVTAPLYSDSVRGDTLSPQPYLEFVQPYEMAIAELHGGINYWHSCGDTTPLLEQLGALPLELFHVGPWTSVRKAAEVFGPKGAALEICTQKHGQYGPGPWPASDDLFRSSPEEVENKIRRIVDHAVVGGATAFSIVAGPLHRTRGAQRDVRSIKNWLYTARSVLSQFDEPSM